MPLTWREFNRLLYVSNNLFENFDKINPLLRFVVVQLVYEIQWFDFYDGWLKSKGLTDNEIEDCHNNSIWITEFERLQSQTEFKWRDGDRETAFNILKHGCQGMSSDELKRFCQTLYNHYVGSTDYSRLFVGIDEAILRQGKVRQDTISGCLNRYGCGCV